MEWLDANLLSAVIFLPIVTVIALMAPELFGAVAELLAFLYRVQRDVASGDG